MIEKRIEGFEGLTIDPETRLESRRKLELDGLACVHEKWSWDGVVGETLVFRESDVGQHDDAALEALARRSGCVELGSAVTMTRDRDGYAFVNFNFRS